MDHVLALQPGCCIDLAAGVGDGRRQPRRRPGAGAALALGRTAVAVLVGVARLGGRALRRAAGDAGPPVVLRDRPRHWRRSRRDLPEPHALRGAGDGVAARGRADSRLSRRRRPAGRRQRLPGHAPKLTPATWSWTAAVAATAGSPAWACRP